MQMEKAPTCRVTVQGKQDKSGHIINTQLTAAVFTTIAITILVREDDNMHAITLTAFQFTKGTHRDFSDALIGTLFKPR